MNNKFRKHFQDPPTEISPLEVKIDDGNFEAAIKQFKRLFQWERIARQLKEREAYEKPSVKKRRKRRQARERRLMLEAREKMIKSGEWEKRQKHKQKKREMKQQNKLQQQEKTQDIE